MVCFQIKNVMCEFYRSERVREVRKVLSCQNQKQVCDDRILTSLR